MSPAVRTRILQLVGVGLVLVLDLLVVAFLEGDSRWIGLIGLGILSGMGYGYVIGNMLGRQGRG